MSSRKPLPLRYISSTFTLSPSEVDLLRDENLKSQDLRKKLCLILDLDNTLIHATRLDSLTPADQHYILFDHKPKGANSVIHKLWMGDDGQYVVKVRPGVEAFLEELNTMYDISIYTMGTRSYANEVAKILDPNDYLFKFVIAREDCTIPRQKGLDVVLSHQTKVMIVDDSKAVWSAHTANLVQIAPYKFFGSRILGIQKLLKVETWSSMDVELTRVLKTLRSVHAVFYDGNSKYEWKDVREVLSFVLRHKLYEIRDDLLDEDDEDGLGDGFGDDEPGNLLATGSDVHACQLSDMIGAMQLSRVSAC